MAGGLLRLVAQHERIFGGDVVAAIAAATTMALAVPGAWWLRNDLRTRRYGSGGLSAAAPCSAIWVNDIQLMPDGGVAVGIQGQGAPFES